MRWSQYLWPTQKETPADAQIASHQLMLRAGLMRKESSGMYSFLPAGFRVLQRIRRIVEEEMDDTGAQQVLLPIMTTAVLWQQSGRWHSMGAEMVRLLDRHSNDYALGPTHEEAMTNMVKQTAFSYRDLPLNLYQIHTKFRDEIRPRYGVMRSREFIMKDAYSFDVDEQGLDEHYQKMRRAYRRIFDRVGLETMPVEADVGAMGGSASEEFMLLSSVGEETIIYCPHCGYVVNQEQAKRQDFATLEKGDTSAPIAKVATPDVKTIAELMDFFQSDSQYFVKSVVYTRDEKDLVTIFIRGDLDINEVKLKNYLGAAELRLAQDEKIRDQLAVEPGYIGPVTFDGYALFDTSVASVPVAITGAGEKGYHYQNVVAGRDYTIGETVPLHLVYGGDPCPKCTSPLVEKPGTELGHIFKLGKKYSESMSLKVLDDNGKELSPIMGCYGIGINRTMAAIIEQHHDEEGILWPISVAPFEVGLISLAKSDSERAFADGVYAQLEKDGWQVLYDDRSFSPGIKFKDMDLVGLPLKVVLGKKAFASETVEVKVGHSRESQMVPVAELPQELSRLSQTLWQGLEPRE